MTNVIDRIADEPMAAEPVAEPAPETPKARFRGLKRLWGEYCNNQLCVQDFYARLEAEERARAEEGAESQPG